MGHLRYLEAKCPGLHSSFISFQSTHAPCSREVADACPANFCCAQDEYLLSMIYCRPFGREGDNCVVRDSILGCPCESDFVCVSTLDSGHHQVLYGTCQRKPTGPTLVADDTIKLADKARRKTSLLSALLPKQ